MSNNIICKQRNNKKNNVEENSFKNRRETNFINAKDIEKMREQLDILNRSSNEINKVNN